MKYLKSIKVPHRNLARAVVNFKGKFYKKQIMHYLLFFAGHLGHPLKFPRTSGILKYPDEVESFRWGSTFWNCSNSLGYLRFPMRSGNLRRVVFYV